MGYKNFQETVLKLKLTSAYIGKIVGTAFVLQVFVFSYFFTKNLKEENFDAKLYAKSYFKKEFAKDKQEQEQILLRNYEKPLLISFAPYLLVFGAFYLFGSKRNLKKESRGAKIVTLKELIMALSMYRDRYLAIGGYDKKTHILTEEDEICKKLDKAKEMNYRQHTIEVPEKFEYEHFCIIGRSGSGKTSLINPLVTQIRERSDRMVIHDYKGDFTKNFATAKDLIFNPAEPERCIKWSVFNDINNKEDIKSIATSLIPAASEKEDPFWKNASRDILIGCLLSLFEIGKATNRDIYELVTADNETIEQALNASPAAARYAHVFAKSNQKTLNSIMSVFRTYTSCFEYLQDIDGDFSIKEWVQKSSKNIFVQNRENIKDAIAPALTLFIDTISRELLSQEDRTDKTVFILDEFGRLNRMSSVLDLFTNGRSKGASIYILAQEFAQIETKYGKDGRKTIVNACSNQIYFGVNDAESAEELSRQIGDEENMNVDESIHHKTNTEEMEGLNVRKHKAIKKVILPSEILNLRQREFLIRLSGQNWTKAKVFIKKL